MSKTRKKLSTPKAAVAKRRARRRRRNPEGGEIIASASKANPPLFRDLMEFALPGFGGYAATRFLHRIAYVQLSKRWPRAGKHLAVGSSVGAFLASWFLVHRIKRLEKYHTPATVGAFIAAAQTIVQTYIPKFGWMVSDIQAQELAAAPAAALPPSADLDDDDDGEVEDISSMGSFGSLTGSTIGRAPASAYARAAQPPQPAAPVLNDELDLGDDDDDFMEMN